MHITEKCVEDGKMSEDFMIVAAHPKYQVYVITSIGPILVEKPEYRNGVSYRAIHKEIE